MVRDEAAYKIWPILVDLARARGKITYSELSHQIGSRDRRLAWPLGLIQEFCLVERLPPLSLLVVRKGLGLPSTGFTALDLEEQEAGFKDVWDHPWSMPNPFSYASDGVRLESLVRRLCADPGEARTIYALVPQRGSAQRLFRLAVLQAYEWRCAFCDISFVECLEAAHIIPWSTATREQRLSPTNGICLCANHHRLFDTGWITIRTNGTIAFASPHDGTYSAGDLVLSTSLEGQRARMPKNQALWPARHALAVHYEMHEWDQAPWLLAT